MTINPGLGDVGHIYHQSPGTKTAGCDTQWWRNKLVLQTGGRNGQITRSRPMLCRLRLAGMVLETLPPE
ncbi:hypothetical protein SY88_08395 [Clostridiales bacterium PH28_bin88]|nr:hypothetical protein SY88_08395 [Clostridiales bacterium PH28_bin88]